MASTEEHEAYFTRTGGVLNPSAYARSWWSSEMLHGRLLGGLAADALERGQSAEGLHFARLTVDLFRGAPMAPVRVEIERVRDGRRIRVADARVYGGNGLVARATAVLLRRGEQPDGHIPSTPAWDVPGPDALPPPGPGSGQVQHTVHMIASPARQRDDGANGKDGDGDGGSDGDGGDRVEGRRAWVRERRELVAGESLSPFVRAALAADTASPLAHAGDSGLRFINADYTLCLRRLPLGDAVGLDASGHTSEEGIAVGHCTLHDAAGPIGYCMTTAVANSRD